MSSLELYFRNHAHTLSVFYWAHARNRISKNISLETVLRFLRKQNAPQILYANSEEVTDPFAFKELCLLITKGDAWAINIGEARFTPSQCEQLVQRVRSSSIAFMFVESIFVGSHVVRALKDIIRERRRSTKKARWLISNDRVQNKVIMKCTNMWWPPWSLGRNKHALMRKK